MEKKKRFIYLTINKINGKMYIGRHTGWFGDNYLGLGRELLKDIKLFGKENFERKILEIVNSDNELNEAEKFWIKKYNADKDPCFYNLIEGGLGGNTLKALTEDELLERSKKIRKTISEYNNERKQIISKRKSKGMINKRKKENSKIKEQRINNFKQTISLKTIDEKKQQYNKISGKNHYCSRRVKTPFGVFDLASEAAKFAKVHTQTVLNRCKNKKFKEWEFIDEKS